MKKILIALFMFILYGCSCLGQIPPVTIYVDENCQANIPDFKLLVTVSDNCEVINLFQNPKAGVIVGVGVTQVRVTAVDASGNESSVTSHVIALDTIAPVITISEQAYVFPDKDLKQMYRAFNCWAQYNKEMFLVAFTEFDTINSAYWPDTLQNTIFNHTIYIPDKNDIYNCFSSLY